MDLRVEICTLKKENKGLWDKLELFWAEFESKSRCAEELTATLAARDQSHVAKLAHWTQKLADCKAVQNSELKRGKELDVNCNRLRSQLLVVEEQLVAARAKLMETELTVQQLKHQTDAVLCAREERCLCGYVEWKIQIMKWMKLDLLNPRLKQLEANGAGRHIELNRVVSFFISDLEETKENLELELSKVLSRI